MEQPGFQVNLLCSCFRNLGFWIILQRKIALAPQVMLSNLSFVFCFPHQRLFAFLYFHIYRLISGVHRYGCGVHLPCVCCHVIYQILGGKDIALDRICASVWECFWWKLLVMLLSLFGERENMGSSNLLCILSFLSFFLFFYFLFSLSFFCLIHFFFVWNDKPFLFWELCSNIAHILQKNWTLGERSSWSLRNGAFIWWTGAQLSG